MKSVKALVLLVVLAAAGRAVGVPADPAAECGKLRAAIEDLRESFPGRYENADDYLDRLGRIEAALRDGTESARGDLEQLRREALLANPLLRDLPGLLVVKRRPGGAGGKTGLTQLQQQIGHSAGLGIEIGMPSNHECNASLERLGYDNEISLLAPVSPEGSLTVFHRPEHGGYVGELDLHFDGDRLLFTQSDETNWKLWEVGADGRGLRQVTQLPDDVHAMDGCYLPDGRIVLGTTASYQSVPCWHGRKFVSNLYLMDADGGQVRQLCFDQDHDWNPTVLPTGQVLYLRWDYTGINHIYQRQLMTMNPDGTSQRAVYGSNSWFPNALFFPQAIPGPGNRLLCILSGYHGPHRMGQLVVVDPSRGSQEERGIVQRISGRGQPVEPKVRDVLVGGDWPKFLHPQPLSDKYFLVSGCEDARSPWRIYLADVFDNLVVVHESPGHALLEPTPLRPRPRPPVIPDRVDPSSAEATVFVGDVHAGPGLAGVPRGTIKSLRVLAYHFGYPGLAGSDKIGYGGPWDAMRILGTTPVEEDGSASFRVPAGTPLAVQALDAEGKAVQLMRSWFTAMPGERVSCVGCHERPQDTGSGTPPLAALREAAPLAEWFGPARGFDFEREVQPVLDRHCVDCHDGSQPGAADFRSEADGGRVTPRPIGYAARLHDDMRRATGGRMRYSPAYDELIHFIRRPGIEDDVSMLRPGEYHADTSELVQLLQKGHQGVRLDDEDWDRIVTWIDLNGPCHGTWGDVFPVPDGVHERRMELRARFGGPADDPERVVATAARAVPPGERTGVVRPEPLALDGWPLGDREARDAQRAPGEARWEVEVSGGLRLPLVRVPAGRFVMGDVEGEPDEVPQRLVVVGEPFWIGAHEVSNALYRLFDPSHDSGYYTKRRDRPDGKGLSLNDDRQPAVRVSRVRALEFCDWLSERIGTRVTLPSEEQWEYACRAGTASPLSYGEVGDDFSPWGNMADLLFSTGLEDATGPMMPEGGVTQVSGGVPHLLLEGAALADKRFGDGFRVTAATGAFRPNRWGLHDMHGNAAEWTLGVDPVSGEGIVRGGSFADRPQRCRSSFRLRYPEWQQVYNVGFRVVCGTPPAGN